VAVQSKPARPRAPTLPRRTTSAAPTRARRSSAAEHATVARPGVGAALPRSSIRPSPGAGGSSRGDHLFLVFFAAMIVMVVAVVLVGAVDRMWVLVPVMLVDLTVTFAVLATLVSLLGDDGGPSG
jgi:hypothetical protein